MENYYERCILTYTYNNKYSLPAEEIMLQRREPHTYYPILMWGPVVANKHMEDVMRPMELKIAKQTDGYLRENTC